MRTYLYATLFALLGSFSFLSAQVQPIPAEPAKWNVQYQAINDQEGYIVLTATIEKGWHIYSQKATDAGPIPTSFSYVSSGEYELVGATEEENPHEIYDKAFDAKVWTFDGTVVFRQKIHLKNTKGFILSLKLEYMACDDSKCIPPSTHSFNLKVPASAKK